MWKRRMKKKTTNETNKTASEVMKDNANVDMNQFKTNKSKDKKKKKKKKKKFIRRAEIEINLDDYPNSDDDGLPVLTTDPDDYKTPFHIRERTKILKRLYRRKRINNILEGRYGSIDMIWNTDKECFEPYDINKR